LFELNSPILYGILIHRREMVIISLKSILYQTAILWI